MATPRIAMIHALFDSIAPAQAAFRDLWPSVTPANILDDSLLPDLIAEGRITPQINSRIIDLGRYAFAGSAQGILYTCSGFPQSIKAAGMMLPIPVLRPNEAAVDAMVDAGSKLAVLATFEPTALSLKEDILSAAKSRGMSPDVRTGHVPGALEALQAKRYDEHDALVIKAAEAIEGVDAILLGQFSMAPSAKKIKPRPGVQILTTPHSAVARLKKLLGG